LVHVGHLAALHQARQLGTRLLVGVHDDATVQLHTRRLPLMSLEERVLTLMACRWVDDIVIGAPFIISQNFLDRHGVDVVVVGDVFEYKTADMDECYRVPASLGIITRLPHTRFSKVTAASILERVCSRREEYERRNAGKAIKDAAMIARGFV
jgi:ethanolamine-phosphate cytidylyltransferase